MGLRKAPVTSLKAFAARLRALPRVVALKVAAAAAPALTRAARETFMAGADAFGDTWMPGERGQRITLNKSGSLLRSLVYVVIGTKVRVQMSVTHAKYQIGPRPVLPRQGEGLPPSYVAALTAIVPRVITAELRAA